MVVFPNQSGDLLKNNGMWKSWDFSQREYGDCSNVASRISLATWDSATKDGLANPRTEGEAPRFRTRKWLVFERTEGSF